MRYYNKRPTDGANDADEEHDNRDQRTFMSTDSDATDSNSTISERAVACSATGCRRTEELQLVNGQGLEPRVLCPDHAADYGGDA